MAKVELRDCPKRVGRACSVALRSTETVVFDPFWPPYASQIHAQSISRTPFQTVSLERLSEKGKRVPRSWISEGAKQPNKAFSVSSWRLTVLAWASLTNFQTVSEEEFSEVRRKQNVLTHLPQLLLCALGKGTTRSRG